MHIWALTTRQKRMLSDDKKTPTLTETEDIYYNSVPPTDCA